MMQVVKEFSALKVLLVEDEPFAQKLATTVLRQLGVSAVMTARDGQEALAVLRKSETQYDLIISDWNMPNMSGIELLREVRRTWPKMPFLMLTGKMTEESVVEARNNGVNAYVVKPFSPDQLIKKISTVLGIKPKS